MAKKTSKKFTSVGTRPQLERMHAIVRRLQKGDYPSRTDLANELNVTTKTVQRDIDFMRDRQGLPIEYNPYKYGYHLTQPVTSFPLMQISEAEIIALFVAQKVLAQYHGTPFEEPLRLACAKLIENLDGEFSVAWSDLDAAISFRMIETNPVDITIFKDLSIAVRTSREVAFDYCKLGSKTFERRQFRPYHLTCINQQWYVLGFDTHRQEERRFVLARMQKLRVLNSTFVRPKNFSADKFLKGSFGAFSGDKPIDIRIWFDSFAARLVQERIWHQSQEIRRLPKDEIELKPTLTSTVEILRWILSWGNHAKALAPAELVKAVAETLEATARHYRVA